MPGPTSPRTATAARRRTNCVRVMSGAKPNASLSVRGSPPRSAPGEVGRAPFEERGDALAVVVGAEALFEHQAGAGDVFVDRAGQAAVHELLGATHREGRAAHVAGRFGAGGVEEAV